MVSDSARRGSGRRRRSAGSVAPPQENPVFQALRRVTRDLRHLKQPMALVGGLAVSTRAEPRLTRDIDLALAVGGDEQAESLVFRLQAHGYRVQASVEQLRAGQLATIRLSIPEAGGVVLDLLFASSGIEDEVVADAELLEVIPGLRIPVARPGHLLALKVLARDDRRRPQDFDDIRALLAIASPAELRRAERALEHITARGFNRKRNLAAAWRRALELMG